MDIEDLLEQLRVRLSRYSLIDSLRVVYHYIQYLQFGSAMPEGIEIEPSIAAASGYDRHYYEWELDLLSRELLQYAPMGGQFSLTRWNEFAGTVDLLKHIDNEIAIRGGAFFQENIFREVNRIAFREFPWQERPNNWRLIRYYKIFGAPSLDRVLRDQIGLSAQQLYFLGLAYTGHYLHSFDYAYPQDFSQFGVSDADLRRFMRHFSRPLSELVKLAPQSELRNEDFAYSQNPLEIYPLVHLYGGGHHRVVAPIPTYLYNRFTSGVYYELTDHRGFSQAFGDSYQGYIGEVLQVAFPAERFRVLTEEEYSIGRDRKDTTDWIVTDASAHLFVECKTKRLRRLSKFSLTDRTALDEDLAKIADAVVQAYKSLADAKGGRYPHWRPDALPTYPVIVFLEDSYLFDPSMEKDIEDRVIALLQSAGIDSNVMNTDPYAICSTGDFEILCQVIAPANIADVLRRKHRSERTKWNMRSFLLSEFGDQISRLDKGGLFPDALQSIHPGLVTPGRQEKPAV
jgi:hypothetical protein